MKEMKQSERERLWIPVNLKQQQIEAGWRRDFRGLLNDGWNLRAYLLLCYPPAREAFNSEELKQEVAKRKMSGLDPSRMLEIEHNWFVWLKVKSDGRLYVASMKEPEYREFFIPGTSTGYYPKEPLSIRTRPGPKSENFNYLVTGRLTVDIDLFRVTEAVKMIRKLNKEFKKKWKEAPSVRQTGYRYRESILGLKGFFKEKRERVSYYPKLFTLYLDKATLTKEEVKREIRFASIPNHPDSVGASLLTWVDPSELGIDWLAKHRKGLRSSKPSSSRKKRSAQLYEKMRTEKIEEV